MKRRSAPEKNSLIRPSLPRFYYSDRIADTAAKISLSPDESHHLLKVLRLQRGESAEVFDAEGRGFSARLDDVERGIALLELVEAYPPFERVSGELHIAVAVLKRRAMDLLIEKLSELGVDTLQPLLTEHCIALRDLKAESDPPERWERLAIAAAKQCGRNRPLLTLPPVRLADWLERQSGTDPRAFAHFENGAPTLGGWLRATGGAGQARSIAIGPEGGWSDAEAVRLAESGFVAVRLGELTLRAETAAIAAAAACRLD